MIREADVDGDGQINYEGEEFSVFGFFISALFTLAISFPPRPEFVKVIQIALLIICCFTDHTIYLSDDARKVILPTDLFHLIVSLFSFAYVMYSYPTSVLSRVAERKGNVVVIISTTISVIQWTLF